MSAVRVAVDEERCCGSGRCVLEVPDVFDQRDRDGVVVLLRAAPGEDRRAAVVAAAGLCPTGAIAILDG